MITNYYKIVNEFSSVAHFALQNTKFGSEKGKVQKPARIPPQTPPAGGKKAEAGQFHSPRKIVCPAESKLVFRIFVKKCSNFVQKTPPFNSLRQLAEFAHGLRPRAMNKQSNALSSTLRSGDLVAQTRRERGNESKGIKISNTAVPPKIKKTKLALAFFIFGWKMENA